MDNTTKIKLKYSGTNDDVVHVSKALDGRMYRISPVSTAEDYIFDDILQVWVRNSAFTWPNVPVTPSDVPTEEDLVAAGENPAWAYAPSRPSVRCRHLWKESQGFSRTYKDCEHCKVKWEDTPEDER